MFRLLRYFSITSLIAFVIVIVLLGAFYRQTAINDLIAIEESKNVALTQLFVNSLGSHYTSFAASVSELTNDKLRTHHETVKLRQTVLAQMKGLSVVKVKIYNLDGLTVFSTEASQIGEDKRTNAGYLSARSGRVASELTHRDTFSAFEEMIEDRDVLSSYIPIRHGGSTAPVEGVLELYSDMTPLLQKIDRTQRSIVVGVTLILAFLHAVLFLIVKRADNIIQLQHMERKQSEEALQKAKDELEIRVAERTAELRSANKRLQFELGERKRAEEVLKTYTVKLEQSNRELQNFAYVASHDLQEPLRKIQTFGDRLRTKYTATFDDQGRDYLVRMQHAAARMQTLIQDLLMYSRVTTKAQPLVPVDLGQIAHEVVSDLEIHIEQVGAQIEVSDLPTIEADPTQMRQLLQNLISNALKFHRKDEPPLVRVHANLLNGQADSQVEGPPDVKWYQIMVSDSGIGFDEKYLERMFQVFQRLHSRDEYEGTGIGLATCRKIVERHEGNITAISKMGQGATFIVTLPLKRPNGEMISPRQERI